MQNIYNAETGCCPEFDPAGWDQTEHTWTKKFVTDKIRAIMHMPLDMGKVIGANWEKILKAGAQTESPPVMLCDESSPWKVIIHIEVTKDVPDCQMTEISGTFVTKVFDGPYSDVKKWYQQMTEYLKSQGKKAQMIYAYYTTCPKCAKHYGHNYTILVAKL